MYQDSARMVPSLLGKIAFLNANNKKARQKHKICITPQPVMAPLLQHPSLSGKRLLCVHKDQQARNSTALPARNCSRPEDMYRSGALLIPEFIRHHPILK